MRCTVNTDLIDSNTETYSDMNDIFLDYYENKFKLINDNKIYWHDPHAECYYEFKDSTEKPEHDRLLEYHNTIINLYNFISNQYKNYGKQFSYDLDRREAVINSFKAYINQISYTWHTSIKVVEAACSNGDVGTQISGFLRDIPDDFKSIHDNIKNVLYQEVKENGAKDIILGIAGNKSDLWRKSAKQFINH